MTRYVALLRGINVGNIKIKMADLRDVVTGLGYDEVGTVLASGNVLFTTATTDRAALKADIEAALRTAFGYEAWVFVHDLGTLSRIVADYPFEPEHDTRQPYVMFTATPEVLSGLLALQDDLDPAVERIETGDGVLYWEVERGRTLDSTFGKNLGKPKLKAVTTTRNLRTLTKLLA